MPHLENWAVVHRFTDPYKAPEAQRALHGNVSGHPIITDGELVTTAVICVVDVQNETVTTRSGSIYTLGAVHPDYLAQFPDARSRLFKQSEA